MVPVVRISVGGPEACKLPEEVVFSFWRACCRHIHCSSSDLLTLSGWPAAVFSIWLILQTSRL